MEVFDIQHVLIAIVTALLTSGITWYIALRKLKPEIRNIDAQTVETQARAWSLLVESQGESIVRLTARVEELEKELRQRDRESEERDRRIRELQDQLEQKDDLIEIQQGRITALETKVTELEHELEEWKSGRKARIKAAPKKEMQI